MFSGGVRNNADALDLWHLLVATGKPTPEAKSEAKPEVRRVAETVKGFLAKGEGRLKSSTVLWYSHQPTLYSEKHGEAKVDAITARSAQTYGG